jgi:hypothetical protein
VTTSPRSIGGCSGCVVAGWVSCCQWGVLVRVCEGLGLVALGGFCGVPDREIRSAGCGSEKAQRGERCRERCRPWPAGRESQRGFAGPVDEPPGECEEPGACGARNDQLLLDANLAEDAGPAKVTSIRLMVCDTRVTESVSWVVMPNEVEDVHRPSPGDLSRGYATYLTPTPPVDRGLERAPVGQVVGLQRSAHLTSLTVITSATASAIWSSR